MSSHSHFISMQLLKFLMHKEKNVLLFLQSGFNFARATVGCAVLERTLGIQPFSEPSAFMILKLDTLADFCPLTLMRLARFVITL